MSENGGLKVSCVLNFRISVREFFPWSTPGKWVATCELEIFLSEVTQLSLFAGDSIPAPVVHGVAVLVRPDLSMRALCGSCSRGDGVQSLRSERRSRSVSGGPLGAEDFTPCPRNEDRVMQGEVHGQAGALLSYCCTPSGDGPYRTLWGFCPWKLPRGSVSSSGGVVFEFRSLSAWNSLKISLLKIS